MGIFDSIREKGDVWAEARMGEQANLELINLATPPAKKEVIVTELRKELIRQGRDPDVPFVHEDVVVPVKDALDPIGGWIDRWKIPLGIGAFAVGGMLLLGYSGLGPSVGKVVERRIK